MLQHAVTMLTTSSFVSIPLNLQLISTWVAVFEKVLFLFVFPSEQLKKNKSHSHNLWKF